MSPGTAEIEKISTFLAASFGRGTDLSVHRIITLYLFRTKEKKRKRAETRKLNRELKQKQNGGIIRVLLKDCLPGLVSHKHISHKHISHFRIDLHRHIDKAMFFDREQYKAKRAGKGSP
jgi:hypothetical protein